MGWKSFGRRGEVLENLIDLTNEYYRKNKLARIDKIPTPIVVTEIDENGLVKKGYFEKKSTVDYQGIAQGIHLAFDAKETNQKSFPLKNIHEHQVEFMRDIKLQGGLSFLIIHYKIQDKYCLLPFEILDEYYSCAQNGGRKSIPFEAIESCFYIDTKTGYLHYLKVINNYIDYYGLKL